MASHAAAEQRLLDAVSDLHDYLWSGARLDERKLLTRLERGVRRLDAHVVARGRIVASVRPILRHFQRRTHGADLFAFLQATSHLAFAADRVVRRPKEATKASSEIVVSLCIHLASAAGRVDVVDAFEAGRSDFGEFTATLGDLLEERGVLRAQEFRRAANQAFDIQALWDGHAAPEAKRIMASASVASSAFACILFVDGLRALGRYRDEPYRRMVPIVYAILRRAARHP